jgi:hypothetical protein
VFCSGSGGSGGGSCDAQSGASREDERPRGRQAVAGTPPARTWTVPCSFGAAWALLMEEMTAKAMEPSAPTAIAV